MIQTTATKKVHKTILENWDTKKNFIFQGGQGAGKTFSLLQVLCSIAKLHKQEIIIASEELTKMRLTIIKDFIKIMQTMNIFVPDKFKAGTEYTFANGSYIKFIGLDKDDVGKGLRCDILYINEANKTEYDKVHELISRAKKRIFDYNPNTKFWIDEYFKGHPDTEMMILTFLDNEALSESERETIEDYKRRGFVNPDFGVYDFEENVKSQFWANKWRVYGLGLTGKIDGIIYDNWKIGDFDNSLPHRYGLDFGYSNDPDAMVKVAIDEKRRRIYLKEEMYSNKQSSEILLSRIKSIIEDEDDLIIADSAEPRLIDDLRNDVNIIPTIKWKVKERIKKVQSYEIIVTPESINLITELENYKWSDKKSELPEDKFNHLLDAVGYAVTGMSDFEFSIS